jgi:hypothetical protein
MIPTRSAWKSWSVLNRVTYVTQLAAALSLLPTVIFAWLGWREARLARTEQTQFFVAEKAPDIEIAAIKLLSVEASNNDVATVYLKNVGGSPAANIHVALFRIGDEKPIRDTADENDFFKRIKIEKGKEFPLPLIRSEKLKTQLGWEASSMRVFRLGDTSAPNETVELLLSVTFEGLFGDKHGFLESIAVTKKMPNPAVKKDGREAASPLPPR